MAVPSQLPSTPDLGGVLSESKRIINAHSRHFLALTVLFLLPLSFSVTVTPTIHQALISRHGQSLLRHRTPSSPPLSTTTALQIAVLYALWLSLLSLCATAAITFSVFHGFYGRPVKLISAIKSLSNSFLPLLVTAASIDLAILGLCSAFWLLLFVVSGTLRRLGFQVLSSSPLYIAFATVCLVALMLLSAYLLVNWVLAGVVSVVEKSWGIDPLRRSSNLTKGMRRLSLSLFVFFGAFVGVLIWISSGSSLGLNGSGSNGWKSVGFVVQIVVTSALISLLLLHGLAATTVLYVYCKAVQGELAAEIAEEEFAWEYIGLPFDADKVPHVVSVIRP